MLKILTDVRDGKCYALENPEPIEFTEHAIERFCEYTGCKRKNAVRYMKRYLRNFVEMELKEKYRVKQLLTYGIENEAIYLMGRFRSNSFLFVISHNKVRTIHKNESNKWEVKRNG